ncbi:hypothetical protein [Pedobacter frigoris]|uniref:Uncharacterized protein n=1 Tax=Pedobacter frigoris TaxID=2571272 RepID=A0A4U1CIT0_9SPHI|nr:hypothetical protein [Pedobacter frigoris]TKC05966.1 hypothetical protein FA047_11540 [Pedobacter frigoris]
MENHKTPKPGSSEYNIEKTESLTTPKFNSTTERRESGELPATENLNDQSDTQERTTEKGPSKPDLGNERRDDEEQREKLITP